MLRYPKLSLGCGYQLARSPLLSQDPRGIQGSPAGSTDFPSSAPKAAGRGSGVPREGGGRGVVAAGAGGWSKGTTPVGSAVSGGEKPSARALQDPKKAKEASFPQRNFASEKHDVRGASPGGHRQMSSDSWTPSTAGVLPGLQFQLREVVASGTEALKAGAGGMGGTVGAKQN